MKYLGGRNEDKENPHADAVYFQCLHAALCCCFRKIPNGGGYAVMAGLDKIIEYLKN
mgnify:CR=1 FL=1